MTSVVDSKYDKMFKEHQKKLDEIIPGVNNDETLLIHCISIVCKNSDLLFGTPLQKVPP